MSRVLGISLQCSRVCTRSMVLPVMKVIPAAQVFCEGCKGGFYCNLDTRGRVAHHRVMLRAAAARRQPPLADASAASQPLPASPRLQGRSLTTSRLLLRPFQHSDAATVHLLASERDIAATTLRIPHPYSRSMAEAFIETSMQSTAAGGVSLAIVKADSHDLMGAIGLMIDREHQRAELGYWVGKPYWGQGFATEAATAVVRYGFNVLGLHRIMATSLSKNLASKRVLHRIGMQHEGCLVQHIRKWGVFEDLELYAVVDTTVQQ